MIFLKAYQAYQQQNYDQCLKLLEEIKDNDVNKLELLAQVRFQKREYQQAYDLYRDLLDNNKSNSTAQSNHSKNYEDNILAIIVCAQLEKPGSLKTRNKDKLPSTDDIIDQVERIDLKDAKAHDIFPKNKKNGMKRRKRKVRLPKQYDPTVAPDPERWLPRKDRKGNMHKQKKRRQKPVAGRRR